MKLPKLPLFSREYGFGHLCNPKTPYVPAAQTDIRQTFARISVQQRQIPSEQMQLGDITDDCVRAALSQLPSIGT